MSHPDDLLLPYVSGDLDSRSAAGVEAHLTKCAACADAVVELRTMHTRLALMPRIAPGLPPVAPLAQAGAGWSVVLRAAAAILLMAFGAGAMWWWNRPAPPPTGGLYALVFYEPVALRASQSVEARRERYRRFGEWQKPLFPRTVDGVKLADESGRYFDAPDRVRTPDRASLPGLALSGLIIIRGDSYAEVAAFVEGCPIFEDGGQVEVRRIR